MIRKFLPEDIDSFPNIKILDYTSPEGYSKEYLLIERKPFISCFVTINNLYGIFIQQYRPIIDKTTLEMPMGKIESFDDSPQQALIRELKEECNLFLEKKSYLLLKSKKTKEIITLNFENHTLQQHEPNYLSPGFSTSLQYPFTLHLSTSQTDILTNFNNFEAFSQENQLTVQIRELKEELLSELDGISKYKLISFLYSQLKNI